MSIHKREGKRGTRWQVKYRDLDGAQHSETFTLRRDAQARETEVRRMIETGQSPRPNGRKLTLGEYVRTRWVPEHVANLAPSTQQHYRSTWQSRIKPHFASLPLTAIDVATIKTWHAEQLEEAKALSIEAGADRLVGQVAIERALSTVLSSILRSAVEDGLIATNPVSVIRKSRVKLDAGGERRAPDPLVILDPLGVEALRAKMDDHDSTLIAVLAYAGLRPGEAWRLRWDDISDDSIRVWGRKTARLRYVPIRGPLKAWLEAWRSNPESDPEYVFDQAVRSSARRDRDEGARDHRAWVRRRFRPAVTLAGLPDALRPYDLRHTCASLLNAEHRSTAEAAAWMGHGHALYLETYCHVIDRYRGRGKVDVDAEIRAARLKIEAGDAPGMFPNCSQVDESGTSGKPARIAESPVFEGDW